MKRGDGYADVLNGTTKMTENDCFARSEREREKKNESIAEATPDEDEQLLVINSH